MELKDAVLQRHSVRAYDGRALTPEDEAALRQAVDDCNRENGLHFQLFTDEPEAFQANKPSYGSFSGCRNYLALVAPKDQDEKIGYYGEKLVLLAQTLGVNSCWVALTYQKKAVKVEIAPGEKLHMVISLGYGVTQGSPRKSKTAAEVSDMTESSPAWYKNGIKAALLAPTAINQQKFRFTLDGDKVTAKAGLGFYAKVDLGIVKYHFELGAEKGHDVWA
ncbi:MAG: nitroreductase [Oscillospiraceae bacterium]|nr:nitroreductase [Oscillospiraceae bacterium]